MGCVICDRCDKFVDLDYNVEEIIFIGDKAVCWDCLTEEEQEEYENG